MKEVFDFLNKQKITFISLEAVLGIKPGTISRKNGIPSVQLPRILSYLERLGFDPNEREIVPVPCFKDDVKRYYKNGRWRRYEATSTSLKGKIKKPWVPKSGPTYRDEIGEYFITVNESKIYFKYYEKNSSNI